MRAHEFLQQAADALKERAATRDQAGGERSMALAVRIFNAARGLPLPEIAGDGDAVTDFAGGSVLSESEGWLFMLCLKIARSQQGGFNADDYTDMAGYAALLGECAALEWQKQAAFPQTTAEPLEQKQ